MVARNDQELYVEYISGGRGIGSGELQRGGNQLEDVHDTDRCDRRYHQSSSNHISRSFGEWNAAHTLGLELVVVERLVYEPCC